MLKKETKTLIPILLLMNSAQMKIAEENNMVNYYKDLYMHPADKY